MRSGDVVVLLSARQLLADIVEREEHFHVQTLIPEPSIEALDEAVLDRLAWPNNIQLYPVAVSPGVHDATGKLTPIAHGEGPGCAPLEHNRL